MGKYLCISKEINPVPLLIPISEEHEEVKKEQTEKKAMLASLIHKSPAAIDHIAASTTYRTARSELAKRKREIAENAKLERARRIKEMGPFENYLHYAFKTEGFITSYSIPYHFSRSKAHSRMFTCGTQGLLSLENINWMKAHSIEHVIVVQKGSFFVPEWWKDTGMTFKQIPCMDTFAQSYCHKLLQDNPEECILVAKNV